MTELVSVCANSTGVFPCEKKYKVDRSNSHLVGRNLKTQSDYYLHSSSDLKLYISLL